jgi:prepilin-type N-terminal cleavage/methylation domain-containing protein
MYQRLYQLRKDRKSESGFTLIELLIVIVILGILAAIVAFSVRGITDRGEESACKAEVKTVATAVEAYYAKNGSYPATVTATAAGGFLRSADTEYVNDALGAGGTMTLSSSPGTCAPA